MCPALCPSPGFSTGAHVLASVPSCVLPKGPEPQNCISQRPWPLSSLRLWEEAADAGRTEGRHRLHSNRQCWFPRKTGPPVLRV